MNKTLNLIIIETNLLIQKLKELQDTNKKLSSELQNNLYWAKKIKYQIRVLKEATEILKSKINE